MLCLTSNIQLISVQVLASSDAPAIRVSAVVLLVVEASVHAADYYSDMLGSAYSAKAVNWAAQAILQD